MNMRIAWIGLCVGLFACGPAPTVDPEIEAHARATANAILGNDEKAFLAASLMAGDTSSDGNSEFTTHADGKLPGEAWTINLKNKLKSLHDQVASFAEKYGPYTYGGVLKSGPIKGPRQFWVFKTYVELKGSEASLVLFIPVTVRSQRGRISTDVPKMKILYWKDYEEIKDK